MSSFGSDTPFMLLAKLKVKEDKVAEYLEIADTVLIALMKGNNLDLKSMLEKDGLIKKNIKKEKCFGKKSAYMIEKVVDEIVLAKARRESDGTYSA